MTAPNPDLSDVGAAGATGLFGTHATRAFNIVPDMARARRFDVYRRGGWVQAAGAVALTAILAWMAVRAYGAGDTRTALLYGAGAFFLLYVARQRLAALGPDTYTKGLLVPGVVTATNPLTLMAVADMRASDRASPTPIWGVRRVVVPSLGTPTPPAVGDRVPCVCLFNNPNNGVWRGVEPRPVTWATEDPAVVAAAARAIDPEEWALLAELSGRYGEGKANGSGVVAFDAAGRPLGRRL